MAIKVYLQTIEGSKKDHAYDPHNSLAKIWPIGDPSFPLLQYIDPYGNVIFNGAQMPEVLRELETLLGRSSNEEQRIVLDGISRVAARCKGDPHMFLRFRGD